MDIDKYIYKECTKPRSHHACRHDVIYLLFMSSQDFCHSTSIHLKLTELNTYDIYDELILTLACQAIMWSRVDRPNVSLTEKKRIPSKRPTKNRLCQKKNEDVIMQGRKACPTSMFSLFFLKIVLGCKPVTVFMQLNQFINRKERPCQDFFSLGKRTIWGQ